MVTSEYQVNVENIKASYENMWGDVFIGGGEGQGELEFGGFCLSVF